MRHLLKIGSSYTGKLSISEFHRGEAQEPTRNMFLAFRDKYSSILEYIEANLILVALQVDDDIFDSLFSLVDSNCKFEQRFPLIDETVMYESNEERVLAPCFVYETKKE